MLTDLNDIESYNLPSVHGAILERLSNQDFTSCWVALTSEINPNSQLFKHLRKHNSNHVQGLIPAKKIFREIQF